jgi:hypothetical protein
LQRLKATSQDRDLVYLLRIAKKHNLTASVLHDSLQATGQHGKAHCGELTIEMRLRGASSSTYMFSVAGKLLSQANLQNDSIRKLKRLPEELSTYLDDDKSSGRRLDANSISAISDLRYGLSGVSFRARVARKSGIRAVTSKNGNPLLVCDVTLSDGTGEIPLAVWNSQIGTVFEGDLVQVQNARVGSFRGQIQLSLGRKTGFLTVVEPINRQLLTAA